LIQLIDPNSDTIFEKELAFLHARGFPQDYRVINVRGDGNCLIYSLLSLMQFARLSHTWLVSKKKKILSLKKCAKVVRKAIRNAARNSTIPSDLIYLEEGDGPIHFHKFLKASRKAHDEEIETFFDADSIYVGKDCDPRALIISDALFVRYFANRHNLVVVVHVLLQENYADPDDATLGQCRWSTRIYQPDGSVEATFPGLAPFSLLDPVMYPIQIVEYQPNPDDYLLHFIPILEYGQPASNAVADFYNVDNNNVPIELPTVIANSTPSLGQPLWVREGKTDWQATMLSVVDSDTYKVKFLSGEVKDVPKNTVKVSMVERFRHPPDKYTPLPFATVPVLPLPTDEQPIKEDPVWYYHHQFIVHGQPIDVTENETDDNEDSAQLSAQVHEEESTDPNNKCMLTKFNGQESPPELWALESVVRQDLGQRY
jgi:hypothetical protein